MKQLLLILLISCNLFAMGQKERPPTQLELEAQEMMLMKKEYLERKKVLPREITFGYSVEDRALIDLRIGNGPKHIYFIGGIHGGYEWNSILLTYQMIDYFKKNNNLIPKELTVHFIATLNPDGLYKLLQKEERFTREEAIRKQAPYLKKGGLTKYTGRFNANGVDLNRNWGYNWLAKAKLGHFDVSGGDYPFSEPESIALKKLIMKSGAEAVLFYHSAFDKIFAAGAGSIDPVSVKLGHIYGDASGYPVVDYFNAYPLNGDSGDWLSLQGIPSITVELRNHQDIEYGKNIAGVLALMGTIAQKDL